MTLDITQPLRLAAGSHKAGSGRGCAMNVISWMMGDKKITDYPSCVASTLADLIQLCNDEIAMLSDETELVDDGEYVELLKPEHAMRLMEISFDAIGITNYYMTVDELADEMNNILESHSLKMVLFNDGKYHLWKNSGTFSGSWRKSWNPDDYLLLARIGVDTYRDIAGIGKPTEYPSNTQVDSALKQMAVVK